MLLSLPIELALLGLSFEPCAAKFERRQAGWRFSSTSIVLIVQLTMLRNDTDDGCMCVPASASLHLPAAVAADQCTRWPRQSDNACKSSFIMSKAAMDAWKGSHTLRTS